MRVLQLLKTSVGGDWALRQSRVLARLGVEIHVVTPDDTGLVGAYREFGARTHVLQTDLARLRRPGDFLAARRQLRQLVDATAPDVIHSHFVGTSLFMRLALGRGHPTPRLFQVPGPLHLENPIVRRVEIASAGPTDYWAASCQASVDHYRRAGVRSDRVSLAYYGVDVSRYDGVAPADLRAELGLAPTAKLIGMVAYVYPPKHWLGQKVGVKGHEDLIDATALLLARGLDVHAVFVGGAWGDGPRSRAYFDQVRACAHARLGSRAHFLGNRTDVAALYPNFDVAVHPSHSENLGGAGESLLFGAPTVATRVGGFPDIVRDGSTGWLVDAKSPKMLAEAIEAVLADPAAARGRAALGSSLVRDLLDVNRTAARVFELYGELTDRRRDHVSSALMAGFTSGRRANVQ
jgi:glycosyltransferase involved in cell wall biosynthesis